MKKIFENWKSKKQLREENIRLQALLNMPPQIYRVERDVMPYKCSIVLEDNMMIEIAKSKMADMFGRVLLDDDLIEWDIEGDCATQILTGRIYIARR